LSISRFKLLHFSFVACRFLFDYQRLKVTSFTCQFWIGLWILCHYQTISRLNPVENYSSKIKAGHDENMALWNRMFNNPIQNSARFPGNLTESWWFSSIALAV